MGSLLEEFFIQHEESKFGQPWVSSVLCSCARNALESDLKLVALEMQYFEHKSKYIMLL